MKPPDPAESPTPIRWLILALSCGASFLLYLHRYTWNIISAKLQEAPYSLNHSQTELLFSLFYYTYAFLQIPSGVVIDRFGPRRYLTISILLWSVALAVLGGIFLVAVPTASGSGLMLVLVLAGISRFLFGAAQAGCYPALNRATRVWFAPQGRTALQGLIASTSGRAGGAASSVVLATVLMAWLGLSWQVSLLWLGGIGIVFGVLFWIGYGDSPATDSRVNDAERWLIQGGEVAADDKPAATAPTMLPWGDALRNQSMRWFVCQQFMDAGSDVAFLSLIGKYFLQARGVDLGNTGWLTGLPLLGGAIGGYVGGWLNEGAIALTGNRRWSRSGVGFTGKVIGCCMLLLVAQQETTTAAAIMLMLAKFFGDWSQPTVWGTCTDIGGRFSATVFSIINTAGTIGGMVMPLIFGRLLDAFTSHVTTNEVTTKVTDWNPLFYLLASMYLSSGLFWLLVDCTKPIRNNK